MSDQIMKYWSEFYQDILDFVELANTEGVELNDLQTAIQQLFDDQFVMASSEQTIKRREKMLKIQANPNTETLDFRKRRIINRYSTKPPFTLRYLQLQLDSLVGMGLAMASVHYANRILTVTADITNAGVFKEVIHTVETIKPANMEYQQNTSTKDVIGIKENISKQGIAWNYKLDGSWKLGEKPFATLEPEEVIK